jgi:hypothetical protein
MHQIYSRMIEITLNFKLHVSVCTHSHYIFYPLLYVVIEIFYLHLQKNKEFFVFTQTLAPNHSQSHNKVKAYIRF